MVTLTLSVAGVDFQLSPDALDPGKVEFDRSNGQITLKLVGFTGSLKVAAIEETTTASPSHAMATEADQTTETPETIDKVAKVTPKASNTAPQKRSHGSSDNKAAEEPMIKRTRPEPSSPAAAPVDSTIEEASQPTLLGQPDFSQTQGSDIYDSSSVSKQPTQPSQELTEKPPAPPSRVQSILETAESTQAVDDDKDETEEELAEELTENESSIVVAEEAPAPKPARVSLGASPVKPSRAAHDPPKPRWGHTFTDIGSNRLLVYGGQTFDAESGFPKTMNDLHIYDYENKNWFRPINCDGMPRQWHTSTFLPERQLLISFGGEASHPKTGKVKTTDQVMVLDTEIMLWYPPSVSGDIPSGRSGHSATMVGNDLVVFGGVKSSKWLSTVSVLDTMRWKWSTPKIAGAPPKPRSYHSATAVGDKIVFFGGNNATQSFNTVHVLQVGAEGWSWVNPVVTGYAPCARTGHSATLLADRKTICVYGGWDPNAEDDAKIGADDSYMIYEDVYLLDTEKWRWSKGPKLAKRVGHEAVRVSEDSILVLGGRVPGDCFTGDFLTIDV